jgi:glutamine synthetase
LREAALPENLYKGQMTLLKEVSTHIQEVYDNVHEMVEARKVANNIDDTRAKAIAYEANVKAKYLSLIHI